MTPSWSLGVQDQEIQPQVDLYMFMIQDDNPKLTFICSWSRMMTPSWPLYVHDPGWWPLVDLYMFMIQDDDPKLTSIYSGLRKKTLSWPLYILDSGGWSQADLYIFRIQEDDPKLTYIYILDSLCSGSNRVSPFICSGLRRMTSSWPLYVQDSGGWPQVDFCMYRIHYDDPKLTSKCSGSRRMTPICWPLHVYDPRGWPQVDFYIFRIQEDDPKLTSIYSGSKRMTPSWLLYIQDPGGWPQVDLYIFRIQEDDPKLTFCNGTVLHKNQVRFSFGDWFQGILELSRNLHQMEIDMSAFSCLAALSLVYGKYCTHGCLMRWYLNVRPISNRK